MMKHRDSREIERESTCWKLFLMRMSSMTAKCARVDTHSDLVVTILSDVSHPRESLIVARLDDLEVSHLLKKRYHILNTFFSSSLFYLDA
jgi:hypothetical protein